MKLTMTLTPQEVADIIGAHVAKMGQKLVGQPRFNIERGNGGDPREPCMDHVTGVACDLATADQAPPPPARWVPCPRCNGKRTVTMTWPDHEERESQCSTCAGSGVVAAPTGRTC